jgi:hypothetical protein
MGKALQFQFGELQIAAEIGSKVAKKDLYGYAKRVAEKDGKILSRGYLMANGNLLPTTALSLVKVDPDGSPAEAIEAQIDGKPAEIKASSFDHAYPLQAVPLTSLASFCVQDVYPISGLSLAAGVYATEFSYRKSTTTNEALLFVRADQSFLLIGRSLKTSFLEAAVTYEFFDADVANEDAEEFDFQMV